ncbi:MAG: response regulator [Bacteroidota bacterium]
MNTSVDYSEKYRFMNEGRQVNILMVDDRPENLMALESTLGDLDLNLVKASSGTEALRWLLKEEFAVILLDVHMPDMDGFETAELIRQRRNSEHTPIIFVTANTADETNLMRGYSLGAVDYIQKPYNKQILRSKVGVFVDLFKKTEEVRIQASNLAKINEDLENEVGARSKAEEIIKENDTRFRAMFENAGIGITMRNPEGMFIKANPAFERILGYTEKELSTMHFTDIVQEEDAKQESKLFEKLLKGEEEQFHFEKRYIRKDGQIIWARAVVSMVYGANKKPLYAVGLSEDITAQRMYTEQLQKLTEELGKSNEDLISAKENAEKANRAKSIFLSTMSHELRTPLNAILGFAQILKKDELIPERQRGFIETIYRSGSHLLDMINDVLDISKIESGRMELLAEDFSLHTMLGDIHNMFSLRAREKELDFTVNYNNSVPEYVFADTRRMRQVLINLLGNSVKFTTEGKIALNVETGERRTVDGKQFVDICFIVQDTGRGIPEDQQKMIFEPFRQMQGTYSEGTGLGLAISRRIANIMGGDITVESKEGAGSTFRFDLPVQLPEKDMSHFDDKQKVRIKAIKGKKKIKVLVVDDVPSNRIVVLSLLEPVGFVCAEAEDGKTALTMAEEFQPDIILMDMRMPIMGGRESFKNLRKNKKTKNIPVIAVSASGYDSKHADIAETGFDGFVSKPFRENELYDIMAQVGKFTYEYQDSKPLNGISAEKENHFSLDETTTAILLLPKPYNEQLCDAIEVQDLDEIKGILAEIKEKNIPDTGLTGLQEATLSGDLRVLAKLSESLRKEQAST